MGGNMYKVSYEEALEMTGFGKFNYLMTAVCGLMILAMVFESLSVSYLVPASACELGTTTVQQGLIAALPLIGIIATSHIWGYLADVRGRRTILRFSLMLAFATGALSALSPHWIVLSLFKIVSSGAVSGTYALAFTLLGETTPRAKRNMLVLSTTSVYLISTGLMAVLAIPVLPLKFSYYIPYLAIYFNSWRMLTLIYSVPCALAALSIYCTHESPKYLLSSGQDDKALATLKAIFASNTGKDPEDFQVKSVVLNEVGINTAYKSVWASVKAQSLPLVRPPLLKNTFILSLEYALIYFCIQPYIVWLPLIADGFMKSWEGDESGASLCQMLRATQESTDQTAALDEPKDCSLNNFAMLVILANSLVLSILNLVVSGLVNCVGRKRLLIIIQVVTAVAGLCVNASTSMALTAVLFMAYLANCLNGGVLTTFSVNLFPTYLKAMAVCLTLMVGRASAFFGINLLKQMLISNCELSFYVFGGLTLAGGLLGLFLPGDNVTCGVEDNLDTADKPTVQTNSIHNSENVADISARTAGAQDNFKVAIKKYRVVNKVEYKSKDKTRATNSTEKYISIADKTEEIARAEYNLNVADKVIEESKIKQVDKAHVESEDEAYTTKAVDKFEETVDKTVETANKPEERECPET